MSASSRGSIASRSDTSRPGFTYRQLNGTITRIDCARSSRIRPPPRAPLSSPARRSALAMSSTGSGRSVEREPGLWSLCHLAHSHQHRGARVEGHGAERTFRVTGAPGTARVPRYASPMRIAVGSDHAGYLLKEFLAAHLAELGHDVEDLGTDSERSVDYPEFGAAVGRAVSGGRAQLGLCACGTGIGIAIAANKIEGVRAAVVHDVTTARLARAHNHANVVCMGGANSSGTRSPRMPSTPSCRPRRVGGRHDRRVEEIAVLDAR